MNTLSQQARAMAVAVTLPPRMTRADRVRISELFRQLADYNDALEQRSVVPTGWQPVPVKPTEEMMDAWNGAPTFASWEEGYALMLAAAPPAPTEQQRDAEDAARYRWLRQHGNKFYNAVHYQGVDEVLDAAIDAARAAKEQK